MTKPIKYKIIKDLALIHDGGAQQLRLNVIQWERQAPKYDLRLWTNSWPEGWIPGKGLLLSESEAGILCRALAEELSLADPVEDDTNAENPGEGAQEAQEGILEDQTIISADN